MTRLNQSAARNAPLQAVKIKAMLLIDEGSKFIVRSVAGDYNIVAKSFADLLVRTTKLM